MGRRARAGDPATASSARTSPPPGIDVNEAEIGERWRIGDALLEVAAVRTPCNDFKNWMGRNGYDDTAWVRRFAQAARPGPYLRVLVEGSIGAGDPIGSCTGPATVSPSRWCSRPSTSTGGCCPG